MVSKAQLNAQAKYDKLSTKQVTLKLNINNDADILLKLDKEENKQGYLKELIRNDMRKPDYILSLESIRILLEPVVRKYEINYLSIFGSYARKEATPRSDVDIIIGDGNYKGLFEFMEMKDSMRHALGREVDVVTKASLEQSNLESDIMFYNNIKRDEVRII